jgi:hypothetical protein
MNTGIHSTSSNAEAIVWLRDAVGLLKLRMCISGLPIVSEAPSFYFSK